MFVSNLAKINHYKPYNELGGAQVTVRVTVAELNALAKPETIVWVVIFLKSCSHTHRTFTTGAASTFLELNFFQEERDYVHSNKCATVRVDQSANQVSYR